MRDNTNVTIIFLIPREGSWPSGGMKVILEYANRLARDGYPVKLVYPLFRINEHFDWLHKLFFCWVYAKIRLSKSYLPTKWFRLDDRIVNKFVWSLETYTYDREATYVATAIHTAYSLNQYRVNNEQKYYFIQDFENWDYTDKDVIASYHLPMHKMVVSNWLLKIIHENGEEARVIPNGFDFNYFKLTTPIRQRSAYEVVCLYHTRPAKDLPTTFKALEIVKREVPELHVTMFGVPQAPELPDWYEYHQKPCRELHNLIYNRAAIYVGTSRVEGWGLTVGEAMICGCAVACTDNKGFLEMAHDDVTALVSPVGDAEAVASNILRLIRDDQLRWRIAEGGNKFIQDLNIEQSYDKFRKVLTTK